MKRPRRTCQAYLEIDGLEIPAQWAICHECRGNGQHAHAIDGDGITSDEWDQWEPDEQEAYMSGHYDRRCEVCNGSGKVAEPILEQCNEEQREAVEAQREYEAELANERRLFRPTRVNGRVLKTTEILRIVQRVDMLINLATAKHHSATNVSLATKNLMGLIWDRSVFHTGLDLSQAIADLALAIRPTLNIIDASRVLLNGGPTGPGPVIKEDRLFASCDILALDSVVASRYSFGARSLSAEDVPHLWATYKNGVGEIDIEKIRVENVKV